MKSLQNEKGKGDMRANWKNFKPDVTIISPKNKDHNNVGRPCCGGSCIGGNCKIIPEIADFLK